jgi:SAM-dependent methyltransferase
MNLDAVDERMFYFRALHERLELCLDRFAPPDAVVLDAGCGAGGLLHRLQSTRPSLHLAGVDISPLACELATRRTGLSIRQSPVESLPFDGSEFDAVVASDLLYMLDDVAGALREIRRCLRSSGILVATVPAYEWMRSYHDRAVGTKHRFTRARLTRLFERNGYEVRFCTYWNAVLFPVGVAARKLWSRRTESDVRLHHPVLEETFDRLLRLELALTRQNVPLPFGLSLLAVARLD